MQKPYRKRIHSTASFVNMRFTICLFLFSINNYFSTSVRFNSYGFESLSSYLYRQVLIPFRICLFYFTNYYNSKTYKTNIYTANTQTQEKKVYFFKFSLKSGF